MPPSFIAVYPAEGTTYPDADDVPITSAGALVARSQYILDALRAGFLLTWDPLDVYEPEDRTDLVGAAPGDAAYVVTSANESLTAEQVLTAGDAIGLVGATISTTEVSDAKHGSRSGGTLHAVATTLLAGFMSAADKIAVDGIAGAISSAISAFAVTVAANLATAQRGFSGSRTFTGSDSAVLSDAGLALYSSVAGSHTFTIPLNATHAFGANDVLTLFVLGAGLPTITATGGVTLLLPAGKTAVARGTGSVIQMKRHPANVNTWSVYGDLA